MSRGQSAFSRVEERRQLRQKPTADAPKSGAAFVAIGLSGLADRHFGGANNGCGNKRRLAGFCG